MTWAARAPSAGGRGVWSRGPDAATHPVTNAVVAIIISRSISSMLRTGRGDETKLRTRSMLLPRDERCRGRGLRDGDGLAAAPTRVERDQQTGERRGGIAGVHRRAQRRV